MIAGIKIIYLVLAALGAGGGLIILGYKFRGWRDKNGGIHITANSRIKGVEFRCRDYRAGINKKIDEAREERSKLFDKFDNVTEQLCEVVGFIKGLREAGFFK